MSEKDTNSGYLQELLYKLKRSVTCSCLYALEEDFNQCGLSLQTTLKNRMILCKIKDNQPYHEEFMKDYIYVGKAEEDRELSKRAIECVMEFVEEAASGSTEIKHEAPSYQNNVSMYGKVIVMNEDVEAVAGDVLMD